MVTLTRAGSSLILIAVPVVVLEGSMESLMLSCTRFSFSPPLLAVAGSIKGEGGRGLFIR